MLIPYSYQHFGRAFEFGDSTIDIELATWPAKLAVPLALSVLLVRLGVQIAGYLRLVLRPDLAPVAVPTIKDAAALAAEEISLAARRTSRDDRHRRVLDRHRRRGAAGHPGGARGAGLHRRGADRVPGSVLLKGWSVAAAVAGTIPHSKTVTYPLSVLPLFILIGFLAFHAGLTGRLFEAARRWVGWVPGGLAVSTVFASAGFAAVSGASTATAAVFSRVAIPDMLKNRYGKRLTAGVIAAGDPGIADPAIRDPGDLRDHRRGVGRQAVARRLAPGRGLRADLRGFDHRHVRVAPDLGQPIGGFSWRERVASVPGALPIFLVVGIIFGALYSGRRHPTEAGALGAMVVFGLYVFQAYRQRAFGEMRGRLREALMETASSP